MVWYLLPGNGGITVGGAVSPIWIPAFAEMAKPLHHGAASCDHTVYHNYDRNGEQQMNYSTHYRENQKSDKPKDEKDQRDGPKHFEASYGRECGPD